MTDSPTAVTSAFFSKPNTENSETTHANRRLCEQLTWIAADLYLKAANRRGNQLSLGFNTR